jgi:hypothetical protein
MTTLERRLGRIAAGFNAKARRLSRRGVVLWTHLAALPPKCYYCGVGIGPMDGSFDHRVSFDDGGSNDPSNIVRCCLSCQRRKFTKTEAEFAEHRRMTVTCPIDGTVFIPRYAEAKRGMARYCSRSCAAKSRWQ